MNIQINKSKTLSKPMSIVLMTLIMIGTFFGGFMFMKHDSKLKKVCTYKTNAIVSDIKESSSSDGHTYAPVYTFEYNGNEYTVSGDVYSSNLKVNKGAEVEIYIDPNDPMTFYSPSEVSGKFFGIILFIVSGVCLLIDIVYIKAIINEKKYDVGY